jgi:hypothetical protein
VAFEPQVEYWHALAVAPGHHVEDAALGGDDGQSSPVVCQERRGSLGGDVVGDQSGNDRDLDLFDVAGCGHGLGGEFVSTVSRCVGRGAACLLR